MKKKKKEDRSDWAIPAFLFIGLGTGFLLLDKVPGKINKEQKAASPL